MFIHWTRDSGLTVQSLVHELIAGNKSLETLIQQYVTSQAKLQTMPNPSGNLSDGANLGEQSSTSTFNQPWGRLQSDGPPARASALLAYGNYLLRQGQHSKALENVWPVVRNDLGYIGQYWNKTSFDLWEEVNSTSRARTLPLPWARAVKPALLAANSCVICRSSGMALSSLQTTLPRIILSTAVVVSTSTRFLRLSAPSTRLPSVTILLSSLALRAPCRTTKCSLTDSVLFTVSTRAGPRVRPQPWEDTQRTFSWVVTLGTSLNLCNTLTLADTKTGTWLFLLLLSCSMMLCTNGTNRALSRSRLFPSHSSGT